MTNALKPIMELGKSFAFKHTKIGSPKYPYNVEPIQLATLINELERLKSTKGNVVEIGVARGMTTMFLCQHIIQQNITCKYYAIDTFESFTKDDIDYEVNERGKSRFDIEGFAYNDYDVWKKNFSNIPFINAIKTDCSVFDYLKISPIKLSFLDVDLYLPTKNTLPKLYDATIVGGTILVDDVLSNTEYDGAYQAYMEFCDEKGFEPKIIGRKCGVIYKK